MKRIGWVLVVGLGCVSEGLAQTTQRPAAAVKTEAPAGYTEAIVLWPGGAPGAVGAEDGDVPKLYSYPAGGGGVHAAVVVLPGGGFTHLVMGKESAPAQWLQERGVSAYVLAYRLGPRYRFPAPVDDAARAVRYLRSHAAELGLRPDAIGMWGFSAGGHLAGYLATVHDAGDARANDAIDRVSDRPDFAILAYARLSMDPAIPRATNMEGLIGDAPSESAVDAVWIAKKVTKDNSPSFVYSTTGDQTVNSLNATAYYDAMKRAGAPVEMHIFERGPHGTGMGQNLAPELSELSIWPTLVEHWMRMHGWMP